MKRKPFRIPDNLAQKIEKDAKEKGYGSINDWGIEAFKHFLTCAKLETTGAMKLIVLKFKDKCLKCNRDVEAGEWALWGRGIGIVCLDCYIERIGDKALIAKYLKNRELGRTKKVLEAECDRLATKLETLRLGDKVEELHDLTSDVHNRVLDYLQTKIGTPQEREALEEILQLARKQFQLQRDIEAFFESTLKIKRWKKKAKGVA